MPDDVTAYAYCLFQQPWWLEAVAPGAWGAVEVEEGGEVVGRLVFSQERRLGLRILTQPRLTHCCGPWIRPFGGKPGVRAAREDRVLERLMAALPPHDVFRQCFHYSVKRWLPFYWAGCRQATQFSYVLEDLSDPDRIWADFHQTVRTAIRKAQKHVTVEADGDVEALIDLNRATFRSQGLDLPYSANIVRRLDAACAARGQRMVLIARDSGGQPCSAVMLVWDDDSVYSVMGGTNETGRSIQADSLLVWEAIKIAPKIARRFDFSGSMIRGVERFARRFGGEPIPYSQIIGGQTMVGRLALAAGDLLLERRRRLRDAH
jgi:hypothetical protein